MAKLLNTHRREVADRVIAATFRERELRLRQEEHALGVQFIRDLHGPEALRKMADLPDGWLPLTTRVGFIDGSTGRHGQVNLTDPIRVPADQNWTVVPSDDWLDRWRSHRERRDDMDRERRSLKFQVEAALRAITTVERLAAAWPEGYAHFPHEGLAAPGPVPMLRVDDLNARLTAAREAA